MFTLTDRPIGLPMNFKGERLDYIVLFLRMGLFELRQASAAHTWDSFGS